MRRLMTKIERTKALCAVTRAMLLLPNFLATRAMNVRVVLVAYVVEEMDLVFTCEEVGSDTVDRGISPTLYRTQFWSGTDQHPEVLGSLPHSRNRPVLQGS